jgi:ATP-dependent RNA helicase DeaD
MSLHTRFGRFLQERFLDSASTPAVSFNDLGLSDASLAAINAVGYQSPSPIQAAFIPIALKGVDVIGQARTGTGKTAAFSLPILERVDGRLPSIQALVLTPTRELSEQVAVEARRLVGRRGTKVACCVGGKRIKQQIDAIEGGAQIVIGTPGRVIDLMQRGMLRTDALRIVVLDEADRMLDIGFRPDIERILRKCPSERQTLLLSATLPPPVSRLAQRYMRSPERVDLSSRQIVVETIDQYYIPVKRHDKFETLKALLLHQRPTQAIVFCRTKRGADDIYRKLSRRLPGCSVMHGDLNQSARDRAMRDFRSGKTRLLVATDVVGRGIDVTGVSHIVNYDVPEFCDDYIHRVGRTGRLSTGANGSAFTFVTQEEGEQLTAIEMRINRMLPRFRLNATEVLHERPVREPGSRSESNSRDDSDDSSDSSEQPDADLLAEASFA